MNVIQWTFELVHTNVRTRHKISDYAMGLTLIHNEQAAQIQAAYKQNTVLIPQNAASSMNSEMNQHF